MGTRKWKTQWNEAADMEGMATKNKHQTINKNLAMQKIHVNKINIKLGHKGEDMMHETTKNLKYSIRGVLEVCKDYARKNTNSEICS